jgi:hypothetical protein
MVSNITTGRIDLTQFAIEHPIAYSLDRQANIYNIIPFGLNTGGSFTALDATVQPVYFAAQQLILGSFVLSIE